MTEDEKTKAAMAEKDKEIAGLKAQLASATAPASEPEPEDLTPYPTQAQLDAAKLGNADADVSKAAGYKTRQTKV